jgi:hypothetical protein
MKLVELHSRATPTSRPGDVVHRDQQHVLLVGDAEKLVPERDSVARSNQMRAASSTASFSRGAGHPVESTTPQPKSARSAETISC